MANADRLIFTLQCADVSPSNYQQIGFALTTPAGASDVAQAQLAAYLGCLGSAGMIAQHVSISDISLRSFGSAGNTPQPFPSAAYADLITPVSGEGYGIPSLAAYGDTFGSGGLNPLGTSISVSEVTNTVGRSGRGRHFVPFTSQSCVLTDGSYGNADTNLALANLLMLGVDINGDPVAGIEVLPVGVCPANAVGIKPIVRYKPQLVFSNLESRRR